MKKLLLILTLISFTAHAMEVDEEAQVLPAGQEQNEIVEEEEQPQNERERISFCIRLGTRLKTCPQRISNTTLLIIGLSAASGCVASILFVVLNL